MMKKQWRGAALIVLILIMPGCWSLIEINDNALVTAVYLDITEEGLVELTLGFPLTTRMIPGDIGGTADGGDLYATVTKTAENIPTAYRKIQADLSRIITWGHTRIIVFSSEFAESGVYESLEFFTRQPDFHLTASVFIAPDKAADIAGLTPAFERLPSEVLHEFVNHEVTLDVKVKDFMRAYHYGGNMLAPLLTIGEKPMISEGGEKSTWVGTGGAALFHKGRIVGELSVPLMRGAMWFERRTEDAVITIDSFTDGKPVSIIVLYADIKKKPQIKDGNVLFELTIEVDDDLLAVDSDIDVTVPSLLHKLEKQFEAAIKERIEGAFKETQAHQADVFNIGQYLEWYYPDYWEEVRPQWSEKYSDVMLECDVTIKINRPGSVKEPPWEKEEIEI
ncbi:Ger(x)C family spore germination protein [Bacillus sp. A116_S68]|nr:Ger(x)C family spore germination protein [Bacillus sp. A116_S68]